MASLREDLEGGDAPRQAMALLQVLNATASAGDVGSLISVICKAVVRGAAAPQCKRLAYDVVRAGGLTDSDWDDVCEGLTADIGSGVDAEVQCAALEVVPLMPPFKLAAAMDGGALHPKITPALRSPLREVRAAALTCLAGLASSFGALGVLGSSAAHAGTVGEWTAGLGDALLDASHTVASSAHACTRRWVGEPPPSEEPARTLKLQAATRLTSQALAAFPAVIARAQLLPLTEQVNAAAMLVDLVRFAHLHGIGPLTTAVPQAPTSSGNSLLGDDLSPSSSPAAAAAAADFDVSMYMNQVAEFLQPMLASLDPALVFEAAKGLLRLGTLGSHHSPAAVQPTWAPLAVAALVELWDRPPHGPAGSQLLNVIVCHLDQLQPLAQVQLARQLIPLAATVASAEARTYALARLWRALLALELQARRAHRSGDRAVSAAELKNVLSDPIIFELVSGNPVGPKENVAATAKYPAFREELVGTLLSALTCHEAGDLSRVQGLAEWGEEATHQPDIAGVLTTAAGMHAQSSMCDWTSAAKIALQGTKACLGWDRGEATGGMHASTAVVDMWFGLLQHALHAVHAMGPPSEANPLGREAMANGKALQELLNQLIVHWKVLSPAVQPRALWLAAHHLRLGAALDATWAGLLKALADALSGNEDASWARRNKAARAAAAEGILAAADSSTLSRGAADPFGAPSLDEGAVSAEASDIALLAAERLTALVLYNAGEAVAPAMKELAASMAAVVQPQVQHGKGGPDSRDRCARLIGQLTRLVSAPVAPSPQDPAQQAQVALLIPDPLWTVHEGFPLAAPYGLALQQSKRVTRYWALHDQVAAATAAAGAHALGPASPAADRAPANEGHGHLPSLLQVMSLACDSGTKGTAQEVSGPADPLRVTVAHSLDVEQGYLSLCLGIGNRLSAELKNLAVRVAVSGPVAAVARTPPLYKVAALPAGDTIEWRLHFRLTGFAPVTVQPLVTLPAKSLVLPGDDPSVRTLPLRICALELLVQPSSTVPPDTFFLRWASMPAGVTQTGVAATPGAIGGVAVLAALEAGPWDLISLQPLPAQGGFHAAFSSCTWNALPVSLLLLGQLVPWPGGGRVLCRVIVRCPAAQAAQALTSQPMGFLPALTSGRLLSVWDLDGLSSPSRSNDAIDKLAMSPQIASLRSLFDAGMDVISGRVHGSEDSIVSEWLRARTGSIAGSLRAS